MASILDDEEFLLLPLLLLGVVVPPPFLMRYSLIHLINLYASFWLL